MACNAIYYVYEHYKPSSNIPFYVGKGKLKRAYSILGRNKYWQRIVAKYKGFEVKFIAKDIDEELAFLVEEERIDQLKKLNIKLCNMTNGGEGPSGFKLPKQALKKLSKIHKGKPKSQDWKNKVSLANTGKVRTPEMKQRMKEIKEKAVLCIDTNQFFNSSEEAAKHFGIHKCGIIRACNGSRKTCHKFKWKYVDKKDYK
jgi:FMN phosphatase YigB (HAD superfamily)